MVAPKEGLPRFRLGQAPPFRPLASAQREPAIRVIDDLHAWYSAAPGENYSRDVQINPSGAWPDIYVNRPPDPGLTEVIRFTTTRPCPVTLHFNPSYSTPYRFRYPIRLYAEQQELAGGVTDQIKCGRIMVEWGAGKARHWTCLDLSHGTFVIPAASWVAVSAWTHTAIVSLGVTAQVGYLSSSPSATWTMLITGDAATGLFRWHPPYCRELTANIWAAGALGHGTIVLLDYTNNPIALWDLWAAIPGAAPAIPYPPCRAPLPPASIIGVGLSAIGGLKASIYASCEVKI